MPIPLRTLILEDRPADVELVLHELRNAGFEPNGQIVDSEQAFVAALDPGLDVILADFSLPQFDALAALRRLHEREIDVPLIVVTGSLSDEAAVFCMKQGAADYLMKDRLARLGQAVTHALEEKRLRVQARAAEEAEARGHRRLQAIFDHTRDAIALADDSGRIVEANPAAEALAGCNHDELLAMATWQFLGPAVRGKETWDSLVNSPQMEGEVQIRRRDGTAADVEFQGVSNITPGLHLVVARDVTNKKKTEEALQHAQKLESLGVLAGGVAHDFNNLLVAVLGNADLALEDLPPESPAVDSVRQIKNAARRAADLARQMLALSGRGRFVVERLDLNNVVEEMTHLLKASIAKGAVLRYSFASNLPAIEADATQVRQIIMNLVVNASDAIGERSGGITVATGVTRADRAYLTETFLSPDLREGDYVYVEVTDTGVGMDPATKAKIFDPFFTTKFTGRGLGLAAVLGIVRAHRGAIKVYSELGKGTTFKVLFPCIDLPATAAPNAAEAPGTWRGSGLVLVVDDEESVRTVAARALERLGFQTVLAEDGREAVAIFRTRSAEIGLVLLDMTMPHLGGEDTFSELRRIRPDVRVVVMSGYNEHEATDRFAGKGLVGFVQKPFELAVLRDVLRQATAT